MLPEACLGGWRLAAATPALVELWRGARVHEMLLRAMAGCPRLQPGAGDGQAGDVAQWQGWGDGWLRDCCVWLPLMRHLLPPPQWLLLLARRLPRQLLRSLRKQADAAQRCGVTQPRINDLLRGRVSRFSLDALVNIATALGRRVSFKLRAA